MIMNDSGDKYQDVESKVLGVGFPSCEYGTYNYEVVNKTKMPDDK